MQYRGVNELRELFLTFFEEKGCLRLNSFSLVPHNDTSLLIINSGMAPMKPWFTGQEIPPRKRVTTCQKCIRTGDLENVGKTARHGTYFEMLGNFSFGDYFKKEAIPWAWEFLTERVGLDPERLYPSVYVDDEEAYNIWLNDMHIPADHIYKFGKADNFWEHGSGPCGPCSEIYYDRGEKYGNGPEDVMGGEGDRFMEVWNIVFSQFNNDGNGNYTDLVQKNIDTGMGLERLAVAVQDVGSIFDVDTLKSLRDLICSLAGGIGYEKPGSYDSDVSVRICTDHARAMTFMISDGIMPSNNGRGYVLRRIIRRAVRHGRKLGIQGSFLPTLAENVIETSKDGYPELEEKRDFILNVVRAEEEKFEKTYEQGMDILAQMEQELEKAGNKELSGEVSAAQAEYDGVTAELQKAQEEKIRREGELRMIDDKIETSESALNDLEAEKKNAAERTAKLEEIRAQAQEKIDGLTAELDRVTEKITEIDSRRDELLSTREQNADMESSINLSILAFKKDVQAKEEAIGTLKRRRSSHEGHADELKAEIDSITEQMTATNELIEQLKVEAAGLREEAQQKKDEISELVRKRSGVEGESTKLRSQERSVSDRRERLSGERARLEERRDSMQRELENAQNKLYDEYQLTRREAEELGIVIEDVQKAQRDLNDIKNKIRALGNVNVGAIEEYKEVSERYEFMKTQIDDVESSRAELLALIGDLTGKMSERFREQFDRINSIFGQTFSELFSGGKAELILENPLDVLECAIEIKVQPPGKNVQNIDLLSGGEKGLAAIALLFSILKVTPAPFCFFDEVEAALDDVNVTRYAQYARRMTKNTQFILITHRRGTMEEADVLYGVTMQEDGVSKLLELKTAEMAKKLGLAQ